jgi:hypothetical protein
LQILIIQEGGITDPTNHAANFSHLMIIAYPRGLGKIPVLRKELQKYPQLPEGISLRHENQTAYRKPE